eukprot:SM000093S24419  [mRNA]  locus=s93:240704:243186:+ [translate_table: standard]
MAQASGCPAAAAAPPGSMLDGVTPAAMLGRSLPPRKRLLAGLKQNGSWMSAPACSTSEPLVADSAPASLASPPRSSTATGPTESSPEDEAALAARVAADRAAESAARSRKKATEMAAAAARAAVAAKAALERVAVMARSQLEAEAGMEARPAAQNQQAADAEFEHVTPSGDKEGVVISSRKSTGALKVDIPTPVEEPISVATTETAEPEAMEEEVNIMDVEGDRGGAMEHGPPVEMATRTRLNVLAVSADTSGDLQEEPLGKIQKISAADEELARQLHRAINSSPRIAGTGPQVRRNRSEVVSPTPAEPVMSKTKVKEEKQDGNDRRWPRGNGVPKVRQKQSLGSSIPGLPRTQSGKAFRQPRSHLNSQGKRLEVKHRQESANAAVATSDRREPQRQSPTEDLPATCRVAADGPGHSAAAAPTDCAVLSPSLGRSEVQQSLDEHYPEDSSQARTPITEGSKGINGVTGNWMPRNGFYKHNDPATAPSVTTEDQHASAADSGDAPIKGHALHSPPPSTPSLPSQPSRALEPC